MCSKLGSESVHASVEVSVLEFEFVHQRYDAWLSPVLTKTRPFDKDGSTDGGAMDSDTNEVSP